MSAQEDLLFAIDGLLAQCATAKLVYDGLDVTAVPIQAIFSSASLLREFVANSAPAPATDGACAHPADRVKRQLVGGGNWILTCSECNEIIEQSGD